MQTLAFSGVAHSVVFQGGNDQIGFDDIGFTSAVPEPSSLVLFAFGAGGASWACAGASRDRGHEGSRAVRPT